MSETATPELRPATAIRMAILEEEMGRAPSPQVTASLEAAKKEVDAAAGTAKPAEQAAAAPAAPATPATADAAAAAPAAKPAAPPAADTPWWAQTTATEEPIVADDSTKAYLKKHFNNDDAAAVVAEYRRQAEELNGTREKARRDDELEAEINSFDPLQQEIIAEMRSGGDWLNKARSVPNLNFGKAGKDQDKLTLVKAYFGNKVSDEEFAEYKAGTANEEVTAKVDTYFELAATKFDDGRGRLIDGQKARMENGKKAKEAMANSITASVAHAATQFPALKARLTQEYAKGLMPDGTGIPPVVRSLLFNKDGTFRTDAVLRLAIAEDGDSILAARVKSTVQAATEAAEAEQIARMPNGGRAQAGGGAAKGSEEVPERIAQLRKQMGTDDREQTRF